MEVTAENIVRRKLTRLIVHEIKLGSAESEPTTIDDQATIALLKDLTAKAPKAECFMRNPTTPLCLVELYENNKRVGVIEVQPHYVIVDKVARFMAKGDAWDVLRKKLRASRLSRSAAH